MKSPKLGFKVLKQKYNALITALVPHKIWEISLPVLERTTYAQTGLVLSKGEKFDTLTDNGTTNTATGFKHAQDIARQLHRLMIKDSVARSGDEYYACQFISGSSKQLVLHVDEMVDFLTSLDKIMKRYT